MSNNKRGQGGQQQQQPQIPEISLSSKIIGKKAQLEIRVKIGNKSAINQKLFVLIGNDRDDVTTDVNGNAVYLSKTLGSGSHSIKVQIFGNNSVEKTIEVEIPKDPSPKHMVYPIRTENEVRFQVTGKPSETVIYNNGNGSQSGVLDSNGYAEFVMDLSDENEHEFFVLVPGPKRKAYRGTFFRYDSRSVGDDPIWIVPAIAVFVIWLLLLLFPTTTKTMPISVVLGMQIIPFALYVWVATKTKRNNIMAVGLLMVTIISILTALYQEAGQNPYDWFVGILMNNSKSLRDLIWYLPEPYMGSGSWVWWLLVPLFVVEMIIFIPFFVWDEAVDFTRKQAEKWSQRPFCLDEEEEKPKVTVSKEEETSSGNFWARTWDKFDEAIIAGVGWDLVYKFITTKKH